MLDPFKVYRQGEEVLREELSALSDAHLRNILSAHALAGVNDDELARISPAR